MARRKTRKKKTSKRKASKKTVKKYAKKAIRKITHAGTVAVPQASLARELSLLENIAGRVKRIDHATSPGRIQRIRAKRSSRKADLDKAWEEGIASGVTGE